jgi:hypothetical protein
MGAGKEGGGVWSFMQLKVHHREFHAVEGTS